MSKSFLFSTRPWVCKDCRTQIARITRQRGSNRAASSATTDEQATYKKVLEPKAAYTVHRKDASVAKTAQHIGAQNHKLNAEAVRRRIESLGGEEKVHELFPRWHRPGKSRAMASSEFTGTFEALPEEKKAFLTDEAGNVTVYGMLELSCNFSSSMNHADFRRQNDITQNIWQEAAFLEFSHQCILFEPYCGGICKT